MSSQARAIRERERESAKHKEQKSERDREEKYHETIVSSLCLSIARRGEKDSWDSHGLVEDKKRKGGGSNREEPFLSAPDNVREFVVERSTIERA